MGLEDYEKLELLGEGQYGRVNKARDRRDDKIVAIKKIRVVNAGEGVSFVGLREVKILKELDHPNVLKLLDVYYHKQNLNLVFEFMFTDLELMIRDQSIILSKGDIKAIMKQILLGVAHMHENFILHRDLKPANLLIDQNGVVKITDFGFSRPFGSPKRQLTPTVCTIYYRAPEILYGAKYYAKAVDMWGVGCIFAELLLRTPLFPGRNEIDQLGKIFSCLGTPTEQEWPGMTSLPAFVQFESYPATDLRLLFGAAGSDAVDLLKNLLRYDPNERFTAIQALEHPYFSNAPAPKPYNEIPLPTAVSLAEMKRKEKRMAQKEFSKEERESFKSSRRKIQFD